jgi:hypothetical protein
MHSFSKLPKQPGCPAEAVGGSKRWVNSNDHKMSSSAYPDQDMKRVGDAIALNMFASD